MSTTAKKYIVALLAAVFCVSVFTMAVFAVDEPSTSAGETSGSSGSSSTGSSKSESTKESDASSRSSSSSVSDASMPSGAVGREPTESTVVVTFNLNGGTGMAASASVDKNTKVSEFKTPVREGYRFVAWMKNGTELPGSYEIGVDTTLTAEWEKIADPQSEEVVSADTHQQEIDSAANAAEQATSDPGTLSSEDWGAILNSSGASGTSSPSSALFLEAAKEVSVSSQPYSNGGFSWLFYLGVGLIALGAAGVCLFVYLQFFRDRRGGGAPGGPGAGAAPDDTVSFTDISSYSDGKRHDDAASLHDAVLRETGNDDGATVAFPAPKPEPEALPAQKAEAAPSELPSAETAEREPVSGRAGGPPAAEGGLQRPEVQEDFDWEKFFNTDQRETEKSRERRK